MHCIRAKSWARAILYKILLTPDSIHDSLSAIKTCILCSIYVATQTTEEHWASQHYLDIKDNEPILCHFISCHGMSHRPKTYMKPQENLSWYEMLHKPECVQVLICGVPHFVASWLEEGPFSRSMSSQQRCLQSENPPWRICLKFQTQRALKFCV